MITLKKLRNALYSRNNNNCLLISSKSAIDLGTDLLFFKNFFKDTSMDDTTYEKNFLLDGSNISRNLSNLMNGHCYDGTPRVGLKRFLSKPLSEFQVNNELLTDFVANTSNILIEYKCNFEGLIQFMDSLLHNENEEIPDSLRTYLLTIVKAEPALCFSWLLLLGLWGPDDILKLSEIWFKKANSDTSSKTQLYNTKQYEGDYSSFISEYPADGGIFTLGSEIRHTWILKNTGSVVWENRHLGCINGKALGYSQDSLNIDIPLTHPGEEVHLTIHMKTPPDDGCYELYWKVMDKDNNLLFPDLGPVGIHFTVMRPNVLADTRKLVFVPDKFEPFSSCGKEDTIETLECINNAITVILNFEPVRIRPEIPDWASIVTLLSPTDYSDMQYIVFDICSPNLEIKQLQFEIKPFQKKWMHFKYIVKDIESSWKTIRIPLSLVELRTLKIVEEICFVVKSNSFRSQENLAGSYSLKNIHFE